MRPVVLGGGLAGTAAAIRLARAGHAPLLIEREAGPTHKICGEFLSGEALAELTKLGLDPAALGARPIGAMRLVHRRRVADIRLPFAAAGLSRLVLDEALLARAAAEGADIRRGVRARSLSTAGGLSLDLGGDERLEASTIFLATGKHDLRGGARAPRQPPEDLVGLKLHLRLRPVQQAELAGHVELVLLESGYAGLQMVEGGAANLCLLAGRDRFVADGGLAGLLAALSRESPHLARRLGDADPLMERPLAIYRVPYGHLHRPSADDPPGLFRLGDQAAVIPSFCGDGMAIALHAARLATQTYLQHGNDADRYHRALAKDAGPPVRLARLVYRATRVGPLRAAAVALAATWPGLVGALARRTRVERSAEPWPNFASA